jgi:hypothetical protein
MAESEHDATPPPLATMPRALSRRRFLGATTVAAAAATLALDQTAAAPTEHGVMPTFWNSFSAMHRRVQDGGWSRQHLGISPETLTAIPHANLALLPA